MLKAEMFGVYFNLVVMGIQYLVCTAESSSTKQNLHINQSRYLVMTAKTRCLEDIKTVPHPGDGLYCNMTFDNVMCWPYTRAGEVAKQRCPDYIIGFNTEEFATKKCEKNGQWQYRNDLNSVWTNYGPCYDYKQVHPLIKEHIEVVRLLSRIGYSISIAVLVFAVFLMLIFKKLHCHRNTIHINLFLSFILRAVICNLKDFLIQGVGLESDFSEDINGTLFNTEDSHWECKLLFTLLHYALGANYIWIFVEGLYLHTIIFVAVFNQKTIFKFYIAIGWLLPLTFVIPWVFVRIFLENTLCWNTHEGGYYWIMRGPITASICINFFFFLNIIRVLFTKLMATNTRDPRRYRKLAKSTLVLIPLFGVYYILFIFIPDTVDANTNLVRFYIETILNSYQGVIVALLFCFLNGEVRTEIKKLWRRRQLRRESVCSTRTSRAYSMTSLAVRDSVSQIPMHDVIRGNLSSSPNFTNRTVSFQYDDATEKISTLPKLTVNGNVDFINPDESTNQKNGDYRKLSGVLKNTRTGELSLVTEESEESSPMLIE